MEQGSDTKLSFLPNLRSIFPFLFIVIAIQLLSGVAIYFLIGTWDDRGSFGAMFGVIDTLFSGLALGGVVYAILLQRKELSLQREEIQLTRKELERTADAQQEAMRLRNEELEMVKERAAAEDQARANEVAPLFSILDIEEDEGVIKVKLRNNGGSVSQPRIKTAPDGVRIRFEPSTGIPRDGEGMIVITLIDDTERVLEFSFTYIDENREKQSLEVICDPWRRQLSTRVLPKADECYLTSACCDFAGLPDDCSELELMRDFRDEYLMKTQTGVSIVSQYYLTAPRILSAIQSSGIHETTMSWIFQQVKKTTDQYANGQKRKALFTYLSMVKTLEIDFLGE